MSHTSTYRARIARVDPAVLAQTMEMLRTDPARPHLVVREHFRTYDGQVFDFALQPRDRGHVWLGLGVRVGEHGQLEFGKESDDSHLAGFLTEAEQAVIQTYVSAMLIQAAPELGLEVTQVVQGGVGQPNRIALTVA